MTPGTAPSGTASASVLPLHTPLPDTADEAFDRLASVVRRVLHVPVSLVSFVDRDRQVLPGAAGLPEPWATTRTTPLTHSFCQHVVASAEPLVVVDAREDPLVAANLAIPDIGVVAYAGMPVTDLDGRVVGALCAIDTTPRQWQDDELALLRDLAAAASTELQLRAALTSSGRSSRRWRVLSALSEALAAPTSVEEVADVVARVSEAWMGAAFGGITLLDATGERLQPVEREVPEGVPVGGGTTFAVDSARPSAVAVSSRQPLFLATVEELQAVAPGHLPAVATADAVSFAYLPLQVGSRVLGALALVWNTPQPFDDDERDLLLGLARYAAQAVERASLVAERRDVARTLQSAMLPTLPETGWLQVAGRYLPAHEADEVGGDWFDAFATARDPDGTEHLTVAVGDVTGHDTAAAAVMGRLQATLRALAVDAPDHPDRLLTRLDQVMVRTGIERLTTAVAAALRRGVDGRVTLSWSNAGHLPPLVLVPGEAARFLERPVDLLLGLRPETVRRTHSEELPAGTTLLLYTDGLVERRGQDLDEGLASLAYAADLHRDLPLPDLLTRIVEVASAGGHDDDLVVFGLRVPDPAAPG